MTTVAQPTPEQLAGVIRGLDNACEYCDSASAFDSARNIREAAAAIGLLRNSFDALTEANKKLREALEAADEALEQAIGDVRTDRYYGDTATDMEMSRAVIRDALAQVPK